LQNLVEDKQLSPTIAYKVYSKLSLEEQSKMIEELGRDKIIEMTQKQTEQYILERENIWN
jgi:hypothetical protein